MSGLTVCVTGSWADVDFAWEQKNSKAHLREMLENNRRQFHKGHLQNYTSLIARLCEINKKNGRSRFVRFICLSSVSISATARAAAITTASASVAATIAGTAAASPAAGATAFIFFTRFFSRPAFEHSLTRQTDLACRVDVCHHHGDLIS